MHAVCRNQNKTSLVFFFLIIICCISCEGVLRAEHVPGVLCQFFNFGRQAQAQAVDRSIFLVDCLSFLGVSIDTVPESLTERRFHTLAILVSPSRRRRAASDPAAHQRAHDRLCRSNRAPEAAESCTRGGVLSDTGARAIACGSPLRELAEKPPRPVVDVRSAGADTGATGTVCPPPSCECGSLESLPVLDNKLTSREGSQPQINVGPFNVDLTPSTASVHMP